MVAVTTVVIGVVSLLGLAGIAISISHLLTPASIVAGVAAFISVFAWLRDNDDIGSVLREWQQAVVHGLLSVLVGLLVYRSILWVLAAAGLTVSLIVGVAAYVVGPWVVLRFIIGVLTE